VTGEHQRGAMPAPLAGAARGKGVVVCEQHHVRASLLGGPRDLGHGAGAIGVRGVQMQHAGEVVQAVHCGERK